MQDPENNQEKWLSGFMKETFKEQKTARRWGIVFKLLTFTYLFRYFYLLIRVYSKRMPQRKKNILQWWWLMV